MKAAKIVLELMKANEKYHTKYGHEARVAEINDEFIFLCKGFTKAFGVRSPTPPIMQVRHNWPVKND